MILLRTTTVTLRVSVKREPTIDLCIQKWGSNNIDWPRSRKSGGQLTPLTPCFRGLWSVPSSCHDYCDLYLKLQITQIIMIRRHAPYITRLQLQSNYLSVWPHLPHGQHTCRMANQRGCTLSSLRWPNLQLSVCTTREKNDTRWKETTRVYVTIMTL